MADIFVEIKGDREVGLKFQQFPERARRAIFARISDLIARLEARVRAAEPSLTGKLRSETRSRVYDDQGPRAKIAGRVFVGGDFSEKTARGSVWGGQIAALEYGAHSSARVKGHRARLTHVFGRPIEPTIVDVDPYTRRVNIAERRFLRDPLAGMESEAIQSLTEALNSVADS